jgi:hypothetical protein
MKSGFSTTELIISISLIALFFLGILACYQLLMKTVSINKYRTIAVSIANEEQEKIKALSYNDIGTIGGYPQGVLSQEETITRNGIEFVVKREISFVADSTDGLAAPDDECPNDYKNVKISVFWQGRYPGSFSLATNISPPSLQEECAIKGGILKISVIDANGIPVEGATIEITNLETSSTQNCISDSSGECMLVLPPGVENYRVVVSKDGYSQERTYSRDEIANPSKPDLTISEGQLTEISFSIDKLSSFTIYSRSTEDQGSQLIPNVEFTLTGSKTIGTDENDQPVYKFESTFQTNADGYIEIPDLEWDSYSFSVDKEKTGLNLISTDPSQPVSLLPDSHQDVTLLLKAENTLLVTVKDQETNSPIFAASVRLYDDQGFDKLQPTDEQGQAFFLPLENKTYSLEVQAENYQTYEGSIYVEGDTSQEVYLAPTD